MVVLDIGSHAELARPMTGSACPAILRPTLSYVRHISRIGLVLVGFFSSPVSSGRFTTLGVDAAGVAPKRAVRGSSLPFAGGGPGANLGQQEEGFAPKRAVRGSSLPFAGGGAGANLGQQEEELSEFTSQHDTEGVREKSRGE